MGWMAGDLSSVPNMGWNYSIPYNIHQALNLTQSSTNDLPGEFFSEELMRWGSDTYHAHPLSFVVKDAQTCTSISTYAFIPWCLTKHTDIRRLKLTYLDVS